MKKHVVSVGAHSLDAELLGGPLLLKYGKEGAKTTLMHVTQGRLEDPNATEEEKKAYLELMRTQNQNAADALGANWLWTGIVSSQMPSQNEFAAYLEDWFLKNGVDLVITHWRGSMHPRHINTHDAVTQAVKSLRKKGVDIDLLYGETFEDLNGFIPQAYFTLSQEEQDAWFQALQSYSVFQGKVNDFPYLPYYTTNLKIREIESGNDGPTVCYMYPSLIRSTLI